MGFGHLLAARVCNRISKHPASSFNRRIPLSSLVDHQNQTSIW
jgi:hypothetical protein